MAKKHTTNYKAERIEGFNHLGKKPGNKKRSKKRVAGK